MKYKCSFCNKVAKSNVTHVCKGNPMKTKDSKEKIRNTIKRMAETPLSEGVSIKDKKFFFPYGDMKKVCKKCKHYQAICNCK